MTEQEFYKFVHRRLAQISIGPSAIRNQGASGLINTLRHYFEEQIELDIFISSLSDDTAYKKFLTIHTNKILGLFPETAQSWGAARKGLNLFLREIVYSKFISNRFSIPDDFNEFNYFVKVMEVPLDKEVAIGIRKDSHDKDLRWVGIKQLTPIESDKFQYEASIIAGKENIARVNLDVKYWRASKSQ